MKSRRERRVEAKAALDAFSYSVEGLSRAREKERHAQSLAARLAKLRKDNHFSPRIRAAYEQEKR